jgi:hypothetical protein
LTEAARVRACNGGWVCQACAPTLAPLCITFSIPCSAIAGVVGGLVIVLLIVGLLMGIALKHRRSTIVMMRRADEISKDGDGFHSPHGFFSSGNPAGPSRAVS